MPVQENHFQLAIPTKYGLWKSSAKEPIFKPTKTQNKNTMSQKGAVWVAVRIPDGMISAHANHARITIFPKEDGVHSISSKNLSNIFKPEVEVVYAQ
jgi:hypothetical protein